MSSHSNRVLILGLDGATWSVLDPMRRRGHMPNLDQLLRESACGTLRSVVPPVTTAAWTTMMTGCDPITHGIFDHRYFDAASRQMKVNHAGRRRVPTLWHVLSDAGRSVVSLNLPGTYPPFQVRGVVVSGMDAPHLEAATSSNPAFAARLRAEAPHYALNYFWKRVPLSLDELAENARLTVQSFLGRAQGGVVADRAFPDWSALMVQFQNLDPFQHRCWRLLNVDHSGIDNPPWNEAAASVLNGLDQAIGMLCELAVRRSAHILVVSDHGFGPCHGRIAVNRILAAAGLVRVHSPIGRMRHTLQLAADRVRLHSLKKLNPKARRASFAASIDAQFPFDWKRTRAFAPHQDTAAMVYLNTRDRNPVAPLATPLQIDEARNEAAIALATARHPETGLPLFPEVISLAEEFNIDPAESGYPDLIALPDQAYWVRSKPRAGESWVEPDPNLPGTHRMEGVVALAGAGISPGSGLDAQLRDIAPSVLTLCGVAVPPFMQGKPLACIPHAARTRQDAPAYCLAGPHKSAAAESFEYSSDDQALIEQRLADLGYLE